MWIIIEEQGKGQDLLRLPEPRCYDTCSHGPEARQYILQREAIGGDHGTRSRDGPEGLGIRSGGPPGRTLGSNGSIPKIHGIGRSI